LNKANDAATRVVPEPRDRSEFTERLKYPNLLTRAELKAIIAEQLG
jgi:hypothetical protein